MSLPSKINTSIRMSVAKRKLESRKIELRDGNPLEQWGLAKIKNDIKNNKELKELFGQKEPDKNDIQEYKLFKFRELIAYALENSPYYRDLYTSADIYPSNIRSYKDLEQVPLTEQEELANKPYHFLCVSRKDIAREFTSSGTTNMLKRMAYTQGELLEIVDSVISGLKMAGMDSKADTLQIMYPTITATWDPGLVLSKACDLAGYSSVINDSMDVHEQMNTIKEAGTTIIIGTSSFLYEISKQIRELVKPGEMGIKRIICSSEPLTEDMREEIENAWGCKTLRQWGMTELGLANAIECEHQNGFHLNNPDFLAEIIDPKTGKILPPGEKGELVVTTLRRKCMPLIRYRTRDITSLIDEPCNCGACLDQRIGDIERLVA
ncbi:phenylacetate--CoA ligase family protein [Methanolobus halotolerans]|uniref:Phenylacetate--CoA ligase n=1 Tax=Methanolobus halotolerans TaxID=2052935 RepID=A0A4E0PUW9_9EURY|nr:AMP-binding protein [Methanolobus halotolerans]TGC08774.1 phenylacetate--CoA ligase [Methanolobus halotolerans]